MKKMILALLFFFAALLLFVCAQNAIDMMQKNMGVKRVEVFEYWPDDKNVVADIKNQA